MVPSFLRASQSGPAVIGPVRSVPVKVLALWIAVVATGDARAQTPVRVATWNVQAVGAPGSVQYEAALDILEHVDADIVGINEVSSSSDSVHLESLAAAAGYPYLSVGASGPFGALRNALLSRFPFAEPATLHSSASLSGDSTANDLTRFLLEVRVDLPGDGSDLTVVTQHWKSGTGNDDEFRRVVESLRILQVLQDLATATDAYVILGDTNEESDSVPRTPNPFTSLPSGLPASFKLGSDLESELLGPGIPNDPFAPLVAEAGAGAALVEALQLDGLDATRPASGRRLDYLAVSAVIAAAGVAAEVYDSEDLGLAGGLPKSGPAPPAGTSLDASDHLLVFADLTVPSANLAAIPSLEFVWAMAAALLIAGFALAALGRNARSA